uniref:Flavodoxin-like domain-containing protein n=1 Tax=candidate division WOR-3 bacterium TaxID=2052148 RepID=A0A7C6EGV7_UNCW3
MHIGIIYYSVTGTTEEFASRIVNGLIKERHHVELVNIKTDVKVTGPGQGFKIMNATDCSNFDFIMFGCPVWAFSACPVIIEAIKKSSGLSGKKVMPFVTMGFPFRCLGGSRAVKQIEKTAREMGADVLPGIVIPKLFHDFKALMDKAVNDIIAIVKNP